MIGAGGSSGSRPLNVVLVNPPFQYFPGVRRTSYSYTRPSLGIAYLAAYLRMRLSGELNLLLIDSEAQNYSGISETVSAIMKLGPDIVGFSTVTGTVRNVSEIAISLKKLKPELVTVAGGPHITALPEENIEGIDVNIFGEGEVSLLEFIHDIVLGGGDKEIDGCVRFKDGEIISRGKKRSFISDLDSIPMPARELLPASAYFHSYPYPNVHGFTTMFTARGCPHSCNFCGNKVLWERKVRYHSLDRVFEELYQVAAGGANLIFIDDDTFNTNQSRVTSICDYIRNNHPDLRWICHIRADSAKYEVLKSMKNSGCVEVQVGVESGDPEVLASTFKSLTVDDVRRTFSWLNELKINSWATIILGNQGETCQTMQKSLEFAKQINPTYCTFIALLPFPGTDIFNHYRKKGYISTYDWGLYTWHGEPVIDLPGLSGEEIKAFRKKAFLEFYLRPGKFIQTAANVAKALSTREIMRNFRAWMSLVWYRT